ncbi:FtsK/SpoIIIE family protein [Brevibacterium sanguinis]|uniref:FtsK/SpoIIIE family protein n=2 Tax=Brevibacterium TaxID=1696 RepID=A0A366IQP9_9MICO|nr:MULTISPECIES: FtsK/SpoIIIE domain-containing protein [Brevibacterium]RBP68136.1 FtsK/SpoIIIE family protein [Brevibacterium sanguinis]RBP74447.1 FtsK/SpoIIIE family protein [Brevibacterium celere]
MGTVGIVHVIDANATVRTRLLDAAGSQPVLDVLRAVFGPMITAADLVCGNRLPPSATVTGDGLAETTWEQWRSLNPVTVLGARALGRTTGTTTVAVVAGPDSGFSIDIDPDLPLLSRAPVPGSVCILDPCLSRRATRWVLDPAGRRPFASAGSTILLPDPSAARGSSGAAAQEVAPAAVEEPRPVRPPQWWAFLIPIAIGIVLALATGMWWFLLFSASAPLSGYVAHAMEKRLFNRDMERFEADTRSARADALDRLDAVIAVHLDELWTGTGLCLGFGSVISAVSVAAELCEDVTHVGGRFVIDDVPVRIDPLTTAVTVTGDHEQLRRMALAWMSDRNRSWILSPELASLPELQGTRFCPGFSSPAPASHSPPDARQPTAATISLDTAGAGGESTLRLTPPTAGASVSLVLGGLAHVRVRSSTLAVGPVPGSALIGTLMPPGRFLTLERQDRSVDDADPFPRHGLGDVYDDRAEAIGARWTREDPAPALIGRGASGAVGVDLFADGPHALVAGTTGSGKSILLQTWLLALALDHPPQRLAFVLIDFKGGATFAPLAPLPHTDCVLDDFDSAAAFRALVSVRAEITRRERLLAVHGRADVRDLDEPPPRLVVVIDEFHALMAAHPQAADLLEHLTALGRSLGVHLILATQRPLGVVTGHMKANINIRLCLRVRDDADSFDVLGVTDAARLPPAVPGAACLDSGASITRFRVATPTAAPGIAEEVLRPRLRPWSPLVAVDGPGPTRGVRIENIVRAARLLEADPGTAAPRRRIVLPPLPRVDGWEQQEHRGAPMVTGIVDVPSRQRQFPWSYDPAVDGSLLALGADAHVVAEALARAAASASATHRIVALGRSADVLDWAEIRCGIDGGWRLRAILDHLRQPCPTPTLVVCGTWRELVDSLDHRTAAEAEQLLRHASGLGLSFLLGGCRQSLASTGGFATQLIFPPPAGSDGMSVGLSRQRFLGEWPRHRAVLVGPGAEVTGPDGADVQVLPYSGPPAGRKPLHPRWVGFEAIPRLDSTAHGRVSTSEQATSEQSAPVCFPLGRDPFGGLVTWDPVRDGPVLTVRGSPGSGKSAVVGLLTGMCGDRAPASSASPPAGSTLRCHDDVHRATSAEGIDLLDGASHVLTLPLRFPLGYGSPVAKAAELGPMLILGAAGRQDLSSLGLTRLPPLDGRPGVGWFVTAGGATAVRTFAPGPGAARSPAQSMSAGGPESVS